MTGIKKCTSCKQEKPITDFPKDRRSSDGLLSICNTCNREKTRIWREANRQRTRDNARKWAQAHPEKAHEISRNWRIQYPEKVQQHNQEYYKAHPEIWQASNAKYKSANPEKVRNAIKKWGQSHREKRLEYGRRWSKKHPEAIRQKVKNRRAKKLGSGGRITTKEWNDLLEKYDHKCLCCGRQDVELTIDHVIPIDKGGPNVISNAQPLCRSCNSRKGTQVIDYRLTSCQCSV